jgi:hypothetical protein
MSLNSDLNHILSILQDSKLLNSQIYDFKCLKLFEIYYFQKDKSTSEKNKNESVREITFFFKTYYKNIKQISYEKIVFCKCKVRFLNYSHEAKLPILVMRQLHQFCFEARLWIFAMRQDFSTKTFPFVY